MKENVIIKKLSIDEIKECVDIYLSVFSKQPWNEINDRKLVEKYYLQCQNNDLYNCYVAKIGNTICGSFVFYKVYGPQGNYVHFDQLCVKDEYQGQGIGKKLLQVGHKYTNNNKLFMESLFTHKQANAYQIYKKDGFQRPRINLDD